MTLDDFDTVDDEGSDLQEALEIEEDEETQEVVEVEGDDVPADLSKFRETKNPEDLPPDVQEIIKGFQRTTTKHNQELTERIRLIDEKLAAMSGPAKDDDPEPDVDPQGSAEEIVDALKKRQDWLLRQAKVTPRLDEMTRREKAQEAASAAIARLQKLPGASKEVFDEMDRIITEDPSWEEIQATQKGQDALFKEALGNVNKKKKEKGTRVVNAAGSQRLVPRKGSDHDIRVRTKDMSVDDVIDAVFRGELE